MDERSILSIDKRAYATSMQRSIADKQSRAFSCLEQERQVAPIAWKPGRNPIPDRAVAEPMGFPG